MNEQKPHLQSYLSRLADEKLEEQELGETVAGEGSAHDGAGEPRPQHPSSSHLDAYAADRLSEEEADAVREHLAVCAACTDGLLARLDPPGGAEEPFQLSEEEKEAQWRQLQRSLHTPPSAVVRERQRPDAWGLGQHTATDNFSELSGGPVLGVGGGPTRRALRWSLALAATFLLTTCLALFWGWREQRIPDPEINLPIAMLVPEEVRTRGAGAAQPEPTAIAGETRTVVVVLVLPVSNVPQEGA
ncbi:MAG: zf-HC2 domain-containing protein, partial [Acidobacteriota bacterium]|nr:zf-HC2 domain-containing protein [Acidobacteriota bacterium]